MRLRIAALVIAACSIPSRVTLATLPTPAVTNFAGAGTAYVGTVNPGGSATLPPVDLAPVSVTTTDGPSGAKVVTVSGGIFEVVHFGLGQLFTGVAGIDGFMVAEVGSIHLGASAGADTTPFGYEAPFPGALGENPFYAQALVNIGGGFVDVVTVPATKAAPNVGDLTTVQLEVLATCALSVSDGSSDLSGFISADLALADGTDLGAVFTMDPVIFSPSDPVCPFGAGRMIANVPVLTPIVLTFDLSVGLSVTAGHGLLGVARQGLLGLAHSGDFPTDHASIDALNTGEVMLVNAEGAGATGSSGHDYTTLNGGPTITTTTTTTTSSIFVPPSTLPGCAGYCGDGIVQPACAETCECPIVGGLAVVVCDAATATPPLAPGCARCAGCAVDLSQCGTSTTSTTTPGSATTSTTPTGPGAATSTTIACRTVRCLLDAGLQSEPCGGETIPPAITDKLDRATKLADEAGGSRPKKRKRLLEHAKRVLVLADHTVSKASRGKRPKLTAGCAAAIRRAIEDVRGTLNV